jgi:hypothetical protein
VSTLICFALKEEAAPFQKIAGVLRRHHPILPAGIYWVFENSPEL